MDYYPSILILWYKTWKNAPYTFHVFMLNMKYDGNQKYSKI